MYLLHTTHMLREAQSTIGKYSTEYILVLIGIYLCVALNRAEPIACRVSYMHRMHKFYLHAVYTPLLRNEVGRNTE